jgi:hypothetical protein
MSSVFQYAQWLAMRGQTAWGDSEAAEAELSATVDCSLPVTEIDGVSVSMSPRQMAQAVVRLTKELGKANEAATSGNLRNEAIRKELAVVREHLNNANDTRDSLRQIVRGLAMWEPRKITKAQIFKTLQEASK